MHEYKYSKQMIVKYIIKYIERIQRRTLTYGGVESRFDKYLKIYLTDNPNCRILKGNKYLYTEQFVRDCLLNINLTNMRSKPVPTHEELLQSTYRQVSEYAYVHKNKRYITYEQLNKYMQIFLKDNPQKIINEDVLRGKVPCIYRNVSEGGYSRYKPYYKMKEAIELINVIGGKPCLEK